MTFPSRALAAGLVLALLLPGCLSLMEDAAPAEGNRVDDAPVPTVDPAREKNEVAAAIALANAANGSDPFAPGPLAVESADYNFGQMVVTNPVNPNAGVPMGLGVPYNSRIVGNVHYPAEGAGPYPLLLFLHGNHGWCSISVPGVGACPEPVGIRPIDSFRGYDYLAQHLASRGYVVVSVDGNDINSRNLVNDYGTQERAQLVLRTLDEFARVNASGGDSPAEKALQGRIDIAWIGLMGHSRGGEGVSRAAMMNEARYDGSPSHALKAIFSLAPTDFYRNLPKGVPFATLLPYCDGDVYNLHGARVYDNLRYLDPADEAPKHQFIVLGANHNFYNTVWDYDDGRRYRDDPHCNPKEGNEDPSLGRRTLENQTRNGLVLMAGFFRYYLGGETHLGPMLRGEAPLPAAACPTGAEACPGLVRVSYMPGASRRLLLEDTLDGNATKRNDAGGAATLTGFTKAEVCVPQDCAGRPNYGTAPTLTLVWKAAAAYTLELPEGKRDVARFTAFTFRAGVVPDATAPLDLRVVLVDGAGASASVRLSDLAGPIPPPPGNPDFSKGGSQKLTLGTTWVPLAAFEGVDLTDVRTLTLAFDTVPGGAVQMTDLLFQR